MSDYVLVTDYEKVKPDDFYLTDEWLVENMGCCCDMTPEQVRDMAERGELFEAFVVSALAYCTYRQMDAQMAYVDSDDNIIVYCESEIIGNGYMHCEKYEM